MSNSVAIKKCSKHQCSFWTTFSPIFARLFLAGAPVAQWIWEENFAQKVVSLNPRSGY